jgi:peptidylprolyl isomerase
MKIFGIVFAVAVIGFGAWYLAKDRETVTPSTLPPTPELPTLSPTDMQKTNPTNPEIVFKTNHGDITIELFVDKMPITTANFLKLTREGFYDGTKFHRIIRDFMIQGGDPNSKGNDTMTYGTGGPGYTIEDEFVSGLSNVRGTIAMANTGSPNTGGSQFFINLVDNTYLDFDKPPASAHPVFGKVIEGIEVIDKIAATQTGANDIPTTPVVIESITVKE